MKLSIAMMVKNEEKHLEKCLQSLKPIMEAVSSELIIVDTGSEDNTVEIARKYTDKVYFHPWKDDFSAMRNITISYARGEWIFILDGDEVLEDPEGLISFLNSSKSKKYNSGFLRIKNFLSENGEQSVAISFLPRLFRREGEFCFRGKIYEQPIFKGPTAEIKTTLLHYGYINTDKELMEKKFLRNIALLKSEVEKDPENIYYWFQLSQSYSMHKDYPEALEAILKAYDLIKAKKLEIKKYIYVLAHLARVYLQNKKYAQTEKICQEALEVNDGYLDFYFYLGSAQAIMWKDGEAIENLQSYLTKVKEYESGRGIKDLSMPCYSLGEVERAYANLAVLYNRRGEHEKALEHLEKIRAKHILKDSSASPFFNYIDACIKLKKFAGIKDYFDRVISEQEKDLQDLFLVSLEKALHNLKGEDKKNLLEIFAEGESDYALLQKVRLAVGEGIRVDDKWETKIWELDLNSLPEYYGDVLYYLLKNDFPLAPLLQNVRERKMDSFLNYLKGVHEDLSSLLFRYLEKEEDGKASGQTLTELVINKTFAKYLLLLDKLTEEQYEFIFNRYIAQGGKYIRSIYKEDIIQKEQIAAVKDAEDAFLLYMNLAEEHKDKDKVKYIRYLRKALQEYPPLKKGIEIQLEKVKESAENVEAEALSPTPKVPLQGSAAKSELESYKRQVKDNLEKLINAGLLQEAKEIIRQYETMVPEDAEIYSMKGIIAIMENNFQEAEKILQQGLKIDSQNFDLLYNLAYVYEQSQNFKEAYKYYSRAKDICPEAELAAGIEKKLEELKDYRPDVSFAVTDNGPPKILPFPGREDKAVESNQANDEMQFLQKKFKENIQLLIEQGLLKDAKKMVEEYEKIIKDDIDTYSIKGIIAMMEGDMDEALKLINKGLEINPHHVDLLYNKAYLLEKASCYKESYKIYKDLLNSTSDQLLKEEIVKKLKEIKKLDETVDFYGKLSLLAIDKKVGNNVCNYIINWFHEFGFTILRILDADKLVVNKNQIKKYIIMYDLDPKEMQLEKKKKFPDVDNERYFLIEALKKQLLIKFGAKKFDNHLYLTKNESEAKKIIEKLLKKEEIQDLYCCIQSMEKKYKTNYRVVKIFEAFRHRAKTELIYYKDGLAVKKTWKPGNEKYMEREKFAYGELSKSIKYIPPLLEAGENYIIIPYYEDILHKDELVKKRVLTNHILDVAIFFKELYEVGYFNPDIHPGQFVFSEKEGLKAIDFEYLQPYEKKPESFINSYDIQGYPEDFKGDKPNYIGKNLYALYNNLWIKYTGYSLEQIANLVINNGSIKYKEKDDLTVGKVLGLLNYAKTSGKSYDGSLYKSGYHSLKLKGYYFRGQRECSLRLQNVSYDFSNKVVLDLGCNVGGMLHILSDKIKMGVGIDYDYRLINVANAIKTINGATNLSFYCFDLEKEDLSLINNFILSDDGKVDICFLLSVCMWIKNWREVIRFTALISNNLLFETNGTKQQQMEQLQELKKYYKEINFIEEVSKDDPGQPNRKLLFCTNVQIRNVESGDACLAQAYF